MISAARREKAAASTGATPGVPRLDALHNRQYRARGARTLRGPALRADRVGDALLHVAGLGRPRELLFLGIRLAGRRCILLAFRHEALERRSRELLVRRIRLAGRERGCRRDQADGQRQCDLLHGLLH